MRVLLTDRFCDRAKSTAAQTDYFDENVTGLALRVSRQGVKAWTLHFTDPFGKRCRLTLGRYPSTSLANARALGRPNRIYTEDLLAYVKNFRGLEYATDESVATFLYDEMGFIPALSPEGNRFRGNRGGPRGWEFPPLLDLRSRWETKYHGTWAWHEDLDDWQRPSFW